MLSLSVCPKVITLSGFHCNSKNQKLFKGTTIWLGATSFGHARTMFNVITKFYFTNLARKGFHLFVHSLQSLFATKLQWTMRTCESQQLFVNISYVFFQTHFTNFTANRFDFFVNNYDVTFQSVTATKVLLAVMTSKQQNVFFYSKITVHELSLSNYLLE